MARRRVRMAMVPALAGLALLLTACGDDAADPASDASGSTSSPTPSDETPTEPSPIEPSPTKSAPPTSRPAPTETMSPTEPPPEEPMPENGPVAQAIADLAASTGVNPDDIEVIRRDHVTWRDGSMGCPKPGMMYTQALVDGYRIVLRAGGETVHYHGSTGGVPFRCDDPDPNGALDQRS